MQAITSTFRSGEPSLGDVLKDLHVGKIQLPDFQRGWVWDEYHIRSLIASVSLAYPIGAVMFLETGGEGVQFQPRLVEGVVLGEEVEPDYLILDGQQRMTSLYLSLKSGKPVATKTEQKKKISRIFYLDIAGCLDDDADRLDAVLALPPERKLTSDFGRKVELDVSTAEREYEHGVFPLEVLFDQERYNAWRRGFQKKFRNDEKRLDQFDDFESSVLKRFNDYRIPTIELLRDTPKEAVCQVFEKVNTGGVTLTVFELMTAIFAADNFNLRDDWREREARLHEHSVLMAVEATNFLAAVTLLASYRRHQETGSAVSCKRKDILRLQLNEYKEHADAIEQGLITSARFLAREKIFDDGNLPYSTQLIPLSAICAALESRFEEDQVREKLSRWFWCGVFGELYGGANESRFAFDVPEVIAWVNGSEEARTIRDANFDPVRLLSLQTRNSAAYKGVYALLMKAGSLDFLSADPIEITSYYDLAIDIHHIFPSSYCQKQDYPRRKWNSVINKAPLSSRTNRTIGGRAPSEYIGALEGGKHKIPPARVDELLTSHKITPLLLRNDEFDLFIRDRARQLLDVIGKAMGKSVTGRDSEEVISAFGAALVESKSEESVA
ncbi:MAG: DUF262 domain-containing protein [Planctomycetes bacterium]|nr:DUF262 domain-containing protein [Planctomycetota bacterium]